MCANEFRNDAASAQRQDPGVSANERSRHRGDQNHDPDGRTAFNLHRCHDVGQRRCDNGGKQGYADGDFHAVEQRV